MENVTKSTENSTKSTIVDQMKTFKAKWDSAPAGAKRDAALKHYQAAEKAQAARNDDEAIKSLEAARTALS